MLHNYFGFQLTSEQCEILLVLKETGSVQRVSEFLRRDISSVNRQLQKIAAEGELLEKVGGRWRVSKAGEEIADWARDSIQTQRRILSARSEIRVVTRREFASRIVAPRLAEWTTKTENIHVVLLSSEDGVEPWLLSGRADLGLDCGAPDDPLVRYRAIQDEPFSVVASPKFLSAHKIREKERLLATPHLEYTRSHTKAIMKLDREITNIAASFNDIAALRSACIAGLGWAVLPSYTVREEIAQKTLKKINLDVDLMTEQFGVWWMRERKALSPWIERLSTWLKAQDLNA